MSSAMLDAVWALYVVSMRAEPGHIYPLIIFHPYEYQRLPLKIYAAAVCLKANVIEFNKSRFFSREPRAAESRRNVGNRTLASDCSNVVREENKSGVISPQLISEPVRGREGGCWSRNQQLLWRASCFFLILFCSDGEHRWSLQFRGGGRQGGPRGWWPWGSRGRWGQEQWRLQIRLV